MAEDFFERFFFRPADVSDEERAVGRVMSAITDAYDATAKANDFDPSVLSFRRPINVFVCKGLDGYVVLYTNEHAVLHRNEWYSASIPANVAGNEMHKNVISAARTKVGLGGWRGVFLSNRLLEIDDENSLKEAVKDITAQLVNWDIEEELKRQRVVHINPIFTGRNFVVEPDLCFVLMPFNDDVLEHVYEDHIKKALEGMNMRCRRADDIFRNTAIIEDIWESINKARLIVADLTGRNPNVFYEVGVAHTVGKDVVLITQSIECVPFDLRHLRHIQYTYTPHQMPTFQQQFRNTIATLTGRT